MRGVWGLLLVLPGCIEAFPTVSGIDPGALLDSGVRDSAPSSDARDAQVIDAIAPVDATLDARPPDGPRPPLPGELIINEVDYDQDGEDTAEFIELLSVAAVPLDLRTVKVDLVNGANGLVYRNSYLGLERLDPGRRVVLRNTFEPPVPDDVPVVQLAEDAQLQNGPNNNELGDGIRLSVDDVIIDSLAYAGRVDGAGEGDPAPVDPANDGLSISRCGDGADSGDNSADFIQTFATPGRENDCRPIDGDAP